MKADCSQLASVAVATSFTGGIQSICMFPLSLPSMYV